MFITLLSVLLVNNIVSSIDINNRSSNTSCSILNILNSNITIELNDGISIMHIYCSSTHDLFGPIKMQCINGNWRSTQIFYNETNFVPRCIPRCYPPPYIWNGSFQIEGEKTENGMYKVGTAANYYCMSGHYLAPPESKYRVCKDGVWTGTDGYCVLIKRTDCKPPEPIRNGYYVHENGEVGEFRTGQRLHFSCNNGFGLTGSITQECLGDGNWSPKIPPKCIESVTCTSAPTVAHGETTVISGFPLDNPISGTEIEITCLPKYHNRNAPCRASRLQCSGGEWKGSLPICVYSKECPPPPDVRHATPYIDINTARYEAMKMQRFFVDNQISYQCLPGYEIRGNDVLTCTSGCWFPAEPPVCRNLEETYIETNVGGQIVISLVTGTGVLLLLIVICLVIVCRRRKPMSRAVSIQPSIPRPDLADHAALLHHPDRLALIAFADGMQVGQPVLPTYEEAIRDRGPGYTSTRIQRPHWPSLAARRSRNSPNPDSIHVTRQGSFASHSASLRSDPMGSTDTMAVSENSTTVTLDTASSYSGSQPASCRAHCGSLASFDTSSVLNTEGVPLLEENELEEVQYGDDVSLAMENRSMTDNCSFKLSTASDVA